MTILLLPIGQDRFDLYSEPLEDAPSPPGADSGRIERWTHAAGAQWNELVHAARHDRPRGRLAHWRDTVVRRLAESIAEQRTLWALGRVRQAVLMHAAAMTPASAVAARDRLLSTARRHHGLWLAVDVILLVVAGALAPIPGPNLVAYYIGFRAFGHLRSWRGAGRGLACEWTLQPDPRLDELARLATLPHDARAAGVDAVASALNLPRLSAFYDRVVA